MAVLALSVASCGNTDDHSHESGGHSHGMADHHDEHEDGAVHFSQEQFDAMKIQVGPIPVKNLSQGIAVTGRLEVPPQNEAVVTAIFGANISSIKVIEGDDVKKGQVLGYMSHPNLTRLQSEYMQAYNRFLFLEKDYTRQKKLYEGEVASGRGVQQTESDYRAVQAQVASYESQLRQLGLNPAKVGSGEFYDQVPITSPIEGAVSKVNVKTGQYVQPEKSLFEIVNVHHIHADFMVFERDVNKVEKGQRVRFNVQTMPDMELYAKIYSVGKKFEESPKAVHVHAEIENKTGKLLPGMYITGQILSDSTTGLALPEAAITRVENVYFAFIAEKEGENEWMFTPVEVAVTGTSNGWTSIELLDKVKEGAQFALNNAYYIIAELKKEEAEHSH